MSLGSIVLIIKPLWSACCTQIEKLLHHTQLVRLLFTKPSLAYVRYTGADLTAMVREAALAALQEDMAAQLVHLRHFKAALQACS